MDSTKRISELHPTTRQRICKQLNVHMAIGGDYQTFAGHLNMPNVDISIISQKENHTEEILKWWEHQNDATVKKLLTILKKMKRDDIIRIVNEDPNYVQAEPDVICVAATETSKDEVDSNELRIYNNQEVTNNQTEPSASHSPSPPHIDVIEFEDMDPKKMEWHEATRTPIDVLLMVVNDNEFRAFYEILPEPQAADSGTKLGDVYFGTINENRVALVKSGMGAAGKTGAQATCMDAINLLSPDAIIGVGVCFGMKDQQKLADVLVSKKLGTYSQVRVNSDGSEVSRGVDLECDARLSRLFSNKMGWKGVTSLDKSMKPKVYSGLVISGPQLVDNKNRKEQLRHAFKEALGGEMEGEALYNICEHFQVPWIVCKAICDWADGTKNKDWQLYAAAVAASFVKHVLTNNYIPEIKKRKSSDQVAQEPPMKTRRTDAEDAPQN